MNLRELRINLKEEYKIHLKQMDMLDIFKPLKFDCDNAFFKSIILPKAPKQKMEPQGVEQFGENLYEMTANIMHEDFVSIIDPTFKTYITSEEEKLIPSVPQILNQNKKLVPVWFESKEIIASWMKKQ